MPEELDQEVSDNSAPITLGGKRAVIMIAAIMAGGVVMLLIIRAILM